MEKIPTSVIFSVNLFISPCSAWWFSVTVIVVLFWGWLVFCSYLLIGFFEFSNASGYGGIKKAFIMNQIGDVGFLFR
jgi:NADH:ubiquinone oxidoreductase subunit 5 (subunit L)/multisubunit Na+/H+ antiporter MnhA subunit